MTPSSPSPPSPSSPSSPPSSPPTDLASRLWRKDASLWHGDDAAIKNRLGWLDSVGWMQDRAAGVMAWAAATAADYERALVVGMGGASLSAAVFASLVAPARGFVPVTVVDTTHPDDIAAVADGDLTKVLFVVASKSGDTVETVALYDFFLDRVGGDHFVVITDDGSDLHRRAAADGVNKIFINRADIGGRYAALSYFGLVPAALLGVDIVEVLARAKEFCATTVADDPAKNPALALGLSLGDAAVAGKDKLILQLPDKLRVFGRWIEQLVAESTGKDGKGLVPVVSGDGDDGDSGGDNGDGDGDDGNSGGNNGDSGGDSGNGDGDSDDRTVVRVGDDGGVADLGVEFFRWQFATAVAAAVIGVNPFDEPDVAASKAAAKKFVRGGATLPPPAHRGEHYDLYFATDAAAGSVADFRRTLTTGCYLALLAYLPEDAPTESLLQQLAAAVTGMPTVRTVATVAFGPRYLHSTGQLHKGGPPGGRFIQFTAAPVSVHGAGADADIKIPGRDHTFAQLHRAQADGDFAALAERNPNAVMRVQLKTDRLRALAAFVADFTDAVVTDTADPR